MKRLALALLAVVAALLWALWPAEMPEPDGPQPVDPTAVSRPAPLPALWHTPAEPELVARLEPLPADQVGDHPSPTERGFAPPATETGWVIPPPEPPIGPNDSRLFREEPAEEAPFERGPDDTAHEAPPPLSPTELEDHGALGGSEAEEHADGARITWAPGVSQTEYDTAPPEDLTRAMKALPGLPDNHPLLAETRAEIPVPSWPGEGTLTTP